MPYPGVPKELTQKMDRCVSKVMKDGKSKDSAIALCKTSIMSQTTPEKKEKPYKTVASKDNRYLYFSNASFFSKDGKTLNATKEGKLLKNVEIFKAGTYRGIEYKKSALDKMVANFHFLKAHDIFAHVPVRADHPSMFGVGDVIDKVGGYIADLKRVGTKLVADFRITNQSMWDKIIEGSYVNRSSEIGTYDDNEGTMYSPVLFGVAWVDIPAVEGLSPTFAYSKDKNLNIINLNNLNQMGDDQKDVFPAEEISEEIKDEIIEEDSVKETEESEDNLEIKEEEQQEEIIEEEAPKEEVSKEEATEPVEKEQLSKEVDLFEKAFPNEAAELKKYRQQAFEEFFTRMVSEGKMLPGQKEKELNFAKSLTDDQFSIYRELKEEMPKILKFDNDQIATDQQKPENGEESNDQTAEKKAEEFIEETN